ncbi:hypothetical protein J2S04_000256 [Alicyclobacillus tengchongensis]|uniref:Transposase n=1 Tax=Alicyclobacillus tolerans TaxID=90970 RepID=A0ABT9LST4_9BACL|nr:hypothetical protein [Alicyclobacillus tengchongensis]
MWIYVNTKLLGLQPINVNFNLLHSCT